MSVLRKTKLRECIWNYIARRPELLALVDKMPLSFMFVQLPQDFPVGIPFTLSAGLCNITPSLLQSLINPSASLSVAITCTPGWSLIWSIPHHDIISDCHGILSLLQCIPQFLVLRIHKVHGFQLCFITYPRVGASINKEIGDGRSGLPLGGWKGVYEANGFMERGVSFKAVDRVHFQVFLVEEDIKNVVWRDLVMKSVNASFSQAGGVRSTSRQAKVDVQLP